MTGFREQGCGVPLTLLHGISSGAASWHKQMALPGYRVLAWDMPGYGESPMLAAAPANAGALIAPKKHDLQGVASRAFLHVAAVHPSRCEGERYFLSGSDRAVVSHSG